MLATWRDSLVRHKSRHLTITVGPARHGGHGDHESPADDLDALFASLGDAEGGRHHMG